MHATHKHIKTLFWPKVFNQLQAYLINCIKLTQRNLWQPSPGLSHARTGQDRFLRPMFVLRLHIDCPGHCGCFDSDTSIDGSAGSKDAVIDHLMVKLMNAAVNGAGTISWKQSNTASNTQAPDNFFLFAFQEIFICDFLYNDVFISCHHLIDAFSWF